MMRLYSEISFWEDAQRRNLRADTLRRNVCAKIGTFTKCRYIPEPIFVQQVREAVLDEEFTSNRSHSKSRFSRTTRTQSFAYVFRVSPTSDAD
jgi:hypothetical protein